MSNNDAEIAASAVVRMFGAVSRASAGITQEASASDPENVTNVVPLHLARAQA
jgi:hypothetical protein